VATCSSLFFPLFLQIMKKTPCETLVWNVLPCIRRRLAERLKEKGLSQRDIAQKIGVSEAAVSQYLSDKRGRNSAFDGHMEKEIARSAEAVLAGEDAIEEICRLCRMVKADLAVDHQRSIC